MALKRTVCLKARLSSATHCLQLRCLSRTRCQWALLRLLLLLPLHPKPHHLQFHREHCWYHRTEWSCYQINWDLSPCSIYPTQHHLFTGHSLLSGRRVSKWAVNHPGFVLRMDLCFERFIDALIQGLENWSESTGNYGNIEIRLSSNSLTASVKWARKESHSRSPWFSGVNGRFFWVHSLVLIS